VEQYLVRFLECVLEGNALADDREEPLIRHDDHRVE